MRNVRDGARAIFGRTEQIDVPYLVRYTNAPWLVIQAPGSADKRVYYRNEGILIDRILEQLAS